MSPTIRKRRLIILVSRNCFNHSRNGCKFPFYLIELIETKVDLKDKPKEFEGSF